MKLYELKREEVAVITQINGGFEEKLSPLGLRVGARIKAVRYAPFSKGIIIEVYGCLLFLRDEACSLIEVKRA